MTTPSAANPHPAKGLFIAHLATGRLNFAQGDFLMLGALRLAWVPLVAIREGKWRGKTELGHDPKGKTLGILGMGGIGRVRNSK